MIIQTRTKSFKEARPPRQMLSTSRRMIKAREPSLVSNLTTIYHKTFPSMTCPSKSLFQTTSKAIREARMEAWTHSKRFPITMSTLMMCWGHSQTRCTQGALSGLFTPLWHTTKRHLLAKNGQTFHQATHIRTICSERISWEKSRNLQRRSPVSLLKRPKSSQISPRANYLKAEMAVGEESLVPIYTKLAMDRRVRIWVNKMVGKTQPPIAPWSQLSRSDKAWVSLEIMSQVSWWI